MELHESRRMERINRGHSSMWLSVACHCTHERSVHDGPQDERGRCFECDCEHFRSFYLPARGAREGPPPPRISVRASAQEEPERLRPRVGTADRCPYCHEGRFESVPAIRCEGCKAWQHEACVRESRSRKCGACNRRFGE